jgi:hypothetical protein
VKLDTIGDRSSAPAVRAIVIMCDCGVCTCRKSGIERSRNAALERVTSHLVHLTFDFLEALPFTLPDFYREQLKEVAIVVCRCSAGSVGTIEQAIRDVEPYRSRTWRRARR